MALEGPPRLGELAGHDPARGRAWTDYSVPELIDHLVGTHHAYLVGGMPRLLELGRRLVSVEDASLPRLEAVMQVLGKLDEELGPHLLTEEEVLFPWCRRLLAGEPVGDWVTARLHCMQREHRGTVALLDELRRLTDGFAVRADASAEAREFLGGLAGFEADTRLHVLKEEDVLFPAVSALAERAAQYDVDHGRREGRPCTGA